MAVTLSKDVLEDEVAISLAQILAAANKQAKLLGVNPQERNISIHECATNGASVWRINYGAKNPIGRRGGDLMIDVDAESGSVKQVLRGQ
ncbi:MAG: hypothetical protein L0Y72_07525 [Gemmataceae bacterium]|nr:hypothetical protein [Gemmataceae bacterium]MCI0738878.1 hypothetical protein [Gemmataceae bacterium]